MNIKIVVVVLLFFTGIPVTSFSQNLNFGLRQKQSPDELPKSNHSFSTPVRKTKTAVNGKLDKVSDWEYILSEGWEMTEAHKVINSDEPIFSANLDTRSWYNATVPGTVLTTLVEQGVYPDPFWGLNNLLIPDTLCRMDWWYRNAFDIPENKKGNRIKLLLNGINYKAEVWLNGTLLGNINGAFSRGQFDITNAIYHNRKNILAIRILPPPNPGIPHEQTLKEGQGANGGSLCLDGPTFISSEGWDWIPGIRDRNIGIWQDVRLLYGGDAEIIDPQIITDLPLPDTTSVDLIIKSRVKNHARQSRNISLNVQVNDIHASYNIVLAANETQEIVLTKAECSELVLKNPKLWWPNGYGNQNLYKMKLSLLSDGDTLDVKEIRFGVRELEYELSAYNEEKDKARILFNPVEALSDGTIAFDNLKRKKVRNDMYITYLAKPFSHKGITEISDRDMNEHIIIKVNGQRIYCKGGNWGMDDGMKRSSRERLEPYFRLHKNQNFNMIRNWTGESTQESFYELCDEYGMLVFNDFWLSTEDFNLDVLDYQLFLDNMTETVRRFRNHPSIALWCPRNEGFASGHLEKLIAAILAQEDGTRHYLGNSRELNTAPSGPWHYHFNPVFYYTDLAGGFRSEVGTPSLPTASTVREFMAEEDTWPISDVWYYHDWHATSIGEKTFCELYQEGIDRKFGESKSIDEFCRKAQFINYESHRSIFEAWNGKLWKDASGVLLWMSHPAWPSMVWQTYSSNGETSGAYYGAQKACKPLHIQMSLDKYTVDIINTTLSDYENMQVVADIYNPTGRKIHSQKRTVPHAAENKLTLVFTLERIKDLTDLSFVKLTLKDAKGKPIDDNTYWISKTQDLQEMNNMPEVSLKVSAKKMKDKEGMMEGSVIVRNPSKHIAAAINLCFTNNGKNIFPAYFSDGYFFLMPGEEKEISFSIDKADLKKANAITVEGYNVKPITIKI